MFHNTGDPNFITYYTDILRIAYTCVLLHNCYIVNFSPAVSLFCNKYVYAMQSHLLIGDFFRIRVFSS